jgi:hypothetical protein
MLKRSFCRYLIAVIDRKFAIVFREWTKCLAGQLTINDEI